MCACVGWGVGRVGANGGGVEVVQLLSWPLQLQRPPKLRSNNTDCDTHLAGARGDDAQLLALVAFAHMLRL